MTEEKPKQEEKKSGEKKHEKTEVKKENLKKETQEKKETAKEEKSEDKKESKKPVQTKPKVKKTEAKVNVSSVPISTKKAVAVCKFIKGKKIEKAINDLAAVTTQRKAVPMKGEIPHRKGRGMMSGRFPKKTSEHFIKILKGLQGNASVNGLENPVIKLAVANIAQRPYGRFGRVKRKRTHIMIVAKEKTEAKK